MLLLLYVAVSSWSEYMEKKLKAHREFLLTVDYTICGQFGFYKCIDVILASKLRTFIKPVEIKVETLKE